MDAALRKRLRYAVRFFYDLQKLRIQSGNRATVEVKTTELTDRDKEFLKKMGGNLEGLEKAALNEVKFLLKGVPLWEEWFNVRPDQKGCGPTMGGLILTHFNIERCNTVSQMWAWCGLAVRNGIADRLQKGQRAKYDPWLKSKLVTVMPECLIKAVGLDIHGYYTYHQVKNPNYVKGAKPPSKDAEKFDIRLLPGQEFEESMLEGGHNWHPNITVKTPFMTRPWRKFYDDYKHRKSNEIVQVCMGCKGTGSREVDDEKDGRILKKDRVKKIKKCWNCEGTGGPIKWGADDAHRHKAARRYLAKMFLMACWVKWRELEGLPVREPYAVEYLKRKHHEDLLKPGSGIVKPPEGLLLEEEMALRELDAEIEAELENDEEEAA